MKKKTYEELNLRLKSLYPNEDLSFELYEGMKSPCIIKCNTCGTLYNNTKADNALKQKKCFCRKCCDTDRWAFQKNSFKIWLENQEDFELIDDLDKIHSSQEHIKCRCTKCGLIQTNKKIYDYYNNKKCFCTTKSAKKPKEILNEELEQQGYELLEEYQNTDTPTLIRRKMCNHIFKARIAKILKDKYYCPLCNCSKGEMAIIDFLDKNKIEYIRQFSIFTYKKCFIDFFLPQQNIFIEYNGEQHYHPIEHFGGVAIFEEQIKRDKSVREYSNINNIKLLEISYEDFNNIDGILMEVI